MPSNSIPKFEGEPEGLKSTLKESETTKCITGLSVKAEETKFKGEKSRRNSIRNTRKTQRAAPARIRAKLVCIHHRVFYYNSWPPPAVMPTQYRHEGSDACRAKYMSRTVKYVLATSRSLEVVRQIRPLAELDDTSVSTNPH